MRNDGLRARCAIKTRLQIHFDMHLHKACAKRLPFYVHATGSTLASSVLHTWHNLFLRVCTEFNYLLRILDFFYFELDLCAGYSRPYQ